MGAFEPRVERLAAGVVGFEQEQAARRAGRAELDEHGLEQQVAGHRVLPVTAEHDGHGRHAGEGAAADPVEEELQQAGVGGLVGRLANTTRSLRWIWATRSATCGSDQSSTAAPSSARSTLRSAGRPASFSATVLAAW